MKIRKAKALGALALLSAAALAIAGCAPGNTAAPSADPEAQNSLPSTAWTRADAADVQDGGDLTLAVSAMPVNWNTFHIDGNESDTNDIADTMRGGPMKINETGEPVLDENYASSVELTSEDPQVVDIKLNPAAVWEDGTPITVADYVATWQANNGSNEEYVPVSTSGWDQISSIEQGEDEFNVVITFSSIYADWQSLLLYILPASVASDPTTFNTGYTSQAVPSSGPFRVASLDNTAGIVTLERNPNWWGETPKLDTVVFRAVSQDQQGSSFSNGEIDGLYISANADLYQTAQNVEGAQIQASNGLTWTHITMNAANGPLADVNVRKAVASIVNREQIANTANSPVGVPPITQGSYVFMPGQDGYTDEALPYDTEAGAAFLEDAGYTKDGDSWTKDGEALSLTVTVPADTATNIQRAEQIQADLGEFGIPVELVSVPVGGYFSDYIIPGDFEMVTFSWVGTAFPISSTESLFSPVDSAQNFTGITDDRLADLWEQANSELDPEARLQTAEEIDKVLWEYVPIIPIAPLPNVYAVKEGLVNWGATQFETIDWTIVGFANS
ncbi:MULTISPECIES: ABC transporter family substrate-binding protein [Microbacterium]|jgi:peptide/nickel transport system substrate-binding protein|uniref:ABC transporter family substrate-binding protein n=1 Tax=Microbacterium TaxID=33882 RepID=UPI001D17D2C3|nr:ABC transporter family substrate-binding protein [Microbacterium testaceum]MCC4249492.1 ABC transporter family substrate-binding protein [Microbacterium testaceum]